MYEVIIISYDGSYYTETIKGCKRADHGANFVAFISNSGECKYAVNADKLVSYKKID